MIGVPRDLQQRVQYSFFGWYKLESEQGFCVHPTMANIPQIALTTDLASTHSLHSSDGNHEPDVNDDILLVTPPDTPSPLALNPIHGGLQPVHTRSPSDPTLLSPFSISPISPTGRSSLDVPRSPSPSYASSNEGSSIIVPPSPTLSTRSSVHFATSVALRDNKPGDGSTSLTLLNTSSKHGRKPSWASSGHSSLEGTEPDHGVIGLNPLHRATSIATSVTAASPTQTHVDDLSVRSENESRSRSHSRRNKGSKDSDGVTVVSETIGRHSGELPSGDPRKDDDDDNEGRNTRIELIDDDIEVDPAPFAFRPYALASMLDPKNIDMLENLGGAKGLLKGLGTSRTNGLGKKALMRRESFKASDASDGRPGPGIAGQRHDRGAAEVPGIVVTSPGGGVGGKSDDEHDEGDPVYAATLDERRQVYGHNVLPRKASKSLLMLMWMALKDKVLVSVFCELLTIPIFTVRA